MIVDDDGETPGRRLFGREDDLGRAEAALAASRLVTVTGPAGVGKTSLARAVAARAADGGQRSLLVPLAAATDPARIGPAVAEALGLRGTPPIEAVAAALGDDPVLLVLDNLEQIPGAGAAVAALLESAPRARALATSRVALRAPGESELPLPPLPVPPPEARDPAALAANPAVALLLARARRADPGLRTGPEDLAAAAGICRRLDGLPLAIELAAARATLFPLPDLLRRLDDTLDALGRGPASLPPRHRSMRAALAWSHDLLGDDERRLFHALGVFPDGFGPEGLAAVAGEGWTPLDLLAALLDQHLVVRSDRGDDVRYAMPEVVRAFALERLREDPRDEALVFARLADWARDTARAVWAAQWTDREEEAFAAAERDHAALLAGLDWATARKPETALGIAADLWWFWWTRGHGAEGEGRLRRALAAAGPAAAADAAKATAGLAFLVTNRAEQHDRVLPEARAVGERAVAFAEALPDGPAARGLRALATIARSFAMRDPVAAAGLLEQALALLPGSTEERMLPLVLTMVATARGFGDGPAAAAPLAERALAAASATGWTIGVCGNRINLGCYRLQVGDAPAAAELLRAGLAEAAASGWRLGQVEALDGLAGLAAATGRHERAARLLGGAGRIARRWAALPHEPAASVAEEAGATACRALGAAAFAVASAAGAALAEPDLFAEALAEPPAPANAQGTVALSARERQVLRLLVAGRSSKEVARELGISPRTVQTHVERLYDKLGAANRAEAVAAAVRLGVA